MNTYSCSPRILLALIALTACELPTKLGDLSDSGTDATTGTTAATTDPTATDSDTSAGTTLEPELTSTTEFDPSETTLVETSNAVTTASSDTETPVVCDGLDEATCEAVDFCMRHYGVAFEFPGCSQGLVFLGCTDPQDCTDDEIILCKDGTDEVYKVESGCDPTGYSECEPPTIAFCDSCESLTEAECLDEPSECQPLYGAPHVEVDGEVCADYQDQDFLRCVANGGACPPFIPVICEDGSPEQAWDSPSGCVPAGFSECGEVVPSCM
ncbi:hypothetical protein [Nannocystis punicea]|uniref:Uncharacterized protein n=1 Tax=Nannocystis punicea TaxID=2995304 RepID=A0ABY7HBL5_9BACT|nr:hypothetical protein [Nannocystis poenicansa]WAS96498.1 hypothetical protein O0S08_10095 [Nannocystis poenicansa]